MSTQFVFWSGTARAGLGAPHGFIWCCVSDRLLTAAEVAEWLNVPESWVRESTDSGAMPHVELGRYRETDVAHWLEECSRPARPIALRSRP